MGLYQIGINETQFDPHPCLSIDSGNRTAQLDGKPLKLTRKEFLMSVLFVVGNT